uniref:Uncharacterized protein n=1 Tax=Caldilinea aerophila TaxID=133453 RepID=A0A7C1JH72_9CHLR
MNLPIPATMAPCGLSILESTTKTHHKAGARNSETLAEVQKWPSNFGEKSKPGFGLHSGACYTTPWLCSILLCKVFVWRNDSAVQAIALQCGLNAGRFN